MSKGPTGWEERWRRGAGPEFAWYAEKPPAELERVLDAGGLAGGAGLDLGCGDGIAARRISENLAPSVGADISISAVRRARELAAGAGSRAAFVVAEAPTLPFRGGAFVLIFDRGCLHNIARPLWPAYFDEVDRLLAPGGLFQLFVLQPGLPPGLSLRGVRARLRRPREILRRQRSRAMLFERRLRGQLPPSFEVVERSEVPFERAGRRRVFVHILARKRGRA